MTKQSQSGPAGDNPMGTDGFEFIEYATPEPDRLAAELERLAFSAAARHRSKNVMLYRQGDINLIINAEPDSMAESFAALTRPAICAMAFRVRDAAAAYRRALSLGAWEATAQAGVMELRLPAIAGIGDTVIYLIDRYGDRSIYDVDFLPLHGAARKPRGVGLTGVDHVVHDVGRGRTREWVDFYKHLFNFQATPPVPGAGQLLTAPCGKLRIRIEETGEADGGAPEEQETAEGIARVALATADILAAVKALRRRGVEFVEPAGADESAARERLPGHEDWLKRLRRQAIALDFRAGEGGDPLLRACIRSRVDPVAFEIVERGARPQ